MHIAFQAALDRPATSPSLRFGPVLGTRPWPLARAAEPPILRRSGRPGPRQPTRPPAQGRRSCRGGLGHTPRSHPERRKTTRTSSTCQRGWVTSQRVGGALGADVVLARSLLTAMTKRRVVAP